jgi:hypothetical protein
MSFEDNTINSFKKVKGDIESLQHQISQLGEKIESIGLILLKKEKKKTAKKKSSKKKK